MVVVIGSTIVTVLFFLLGFVIAKALTEEKRKREAVAFRNKILLTESLIRRPEQQKTFWDLTEEEQAIHLRALDDSAIDESTREAVFLSGAYRPFDSQILPTIGQALRVKPSLFFFLCGAHGPEHGRSCARPAGHLDGFPLDYHDAGPYISIADKKRYRWRVSE